ncbi:Holliday junction branch migration protein RuvA [Mycoplasma leonicaptivi]|uniref:Holliday junction branch migration protein RuvA n=1 Tax=Mycoplasma leonicaptivi TaxID=36742 RepID=UPI000484B81E|nr:Holliday junction branch migration protein RuvA [Mycoplasma leonicaptivi]
MILYKIGEVVYKNKNNLIFENKGDGYIVSVPQLNKWEVGQKCKMYLYEHNSEYYKQTFGFSEFKERLLFIDLISIDKIGPKVANLILGLGWEVVANYIIEENWKELAKINFVTEKTAKLICVELKNKWSKMVNKESREVSNQIKQNSLLTDLASTLKTLGFSKNQIDYAVSNIKTSSDIDTMIEESINLLTTRNESIITT